MLFLVYYVNNAGVFYYDVRDSPYSHITLESM